MIPPNRIKELREDVGLSQQKFATAIGISYASAQRYEYGQRDIPGDVLLKMVSFFGVSSDYILGASDDRGDQAPSDASGRAFVPVPLYGCVAAGVPKEMIPIEYMKEAPAKFVDDDPDAYFVRVRGNSMSRRIQDSDFALVSPKYTEPNDHDMFLVTVNGDDATIKKVHVLENGVELIPDSYDPTYRPKVFDFGEEGTPPIRILGKIVWWCAAF